MPIRPTSLAFSLMLGAFAALPPLSIDMGLPASPLLQSTLGASSAQAALTFSLFVAGFGLSQLLMGPLSDRFGRRPIMLAGLALYTLGGLGCATAPGIETLLACRFVQGVGAAGAATLAFAIVRDVFSGADARVKIAGITSVMSIAPIIAPTLGGWMLLLGGWRTIYLLLAFTGGVLLVAAVLGLEETRPPSRARFNLLQRYATVLRQKRVVGYAFVNALSFGSLFAFIIASPLVLMHDMGVTVTCFGMLFAMTAFGILMGTWVNARLARRHVAAALPLAAGLVIELLAVVAASVFLLFGVTGVETLMPFMAMVGFCRGLINPTAAHLALECLPGHSGMISAVLGALQMLTASLAGAAVAALYTTHGPFGMTLCMAGFALAAFLAWAATERAAPQPVDSQEPAS